MEIIVQVLYAFFLGPFYLTMSSQSDLRFLNTETKELTQRSETFLQTLKEVADEMASFKATFHDDFLDDQKAGLKATYCQTLNIQHQLQAISNSSKSLVNEVSVVWL